MKFTFDYAKNIIKNIDVIKEKEVLYSTTSSKKENINI